MENPVTPKIKRVDFLGVPFDILPEEIFESFFDKLLEKDHSWKIALLRYKDFKRAVFNRELQNRLWTCGLVLPIDKSLEWGIKFSGLPAPHRYHPFDFVIRLLGYLEKKGKSVYILGGTAAEVQRVFDKIRSGFPKLTIVGRYAGKYPKESESSINKAIAKSSPTFIFVGSRVRGKFRYIFDNLKNQDIPIAFFSKEAFNIMSGNKKIPDRETFKKRFKSGTSHLPGALINPLKWLLIPGYIFYFFMTLWQKYFRTKKEN